MNFIDLMAIVQFEMIKNHFIRASF